MMSVQITPATFFLLIISGVVAQKWWDVNYITENICAVKGSTVIIGCTYKYPSVYAIIRTFWSTKPVLKNVEPPDLFLDPKYRDRVKYLGDTQSTCDLELRDVTESDQSKYYFMFITTLSDGKYQGQPGVQLSVTDLQVESPERVVEGDDVSLMCKTTCNLFGRTYIWYKNGSRLPSKTNPLHLHKVSRMDSGSYSCAVENHHSSAVTLNVRYPPDRIFMTITPSGEIMEGGSVTLICSSDANPPVQNYTWFNRNITVGRGMKYTILNISSEQGGEYTCMSSNEVGTRYNAVTLIVLYPPKNVSVSFSPSGEIVEGSSVTLTCSSDANPPVENYTWFKEGGTSPVGSGQKYSIFDTELYYCVVQNRHGTQRSTSVFITLKGKVSMTIYVVVGVSLVVAVVILSCIFWIRKKRQNTMTAAAVYENVSGAVKDDTYTALDLTARSSDVYHTLATVHPSHIDDTYTALHPHSISPDYDTLATTRSQASTVDKNTTFDVTKPTYRGNAN